jgi:hypothetical protein
MQQLYELARRVAKTHNGKQFPRHAQIEAIQQLQAYITYLENQDQSQAKSVQLSEA